MRLFGFSYSPFVVKVRKCLELKGLPFTYVEVPYLDRREVLALTGGSIHVPVLEDTAFRIACPSIEPRLGEHFGGREDATAVWRLLKERKFGPGCMEAWTREAEALNGRAVELLEPVARAVASRPFLLGDAPSLTDAAVFGQLFFLEFSQPGWIRLHTPGLSGWFDRLVGATDVSNQ